MNEYLIICENGFAHSFCTKTDKGAKRIVTNWLSFGCGDTVLQKKDKEGEYYQIGMRKFETYRFKGNSYFSWAKWV